MGEKKLRRIYYVWHYLEWGGAQVLFFGLMKEAKNISEVTAIMPAGSNEQLLKFLKNLQVRCEFIEAHTDLKPAHTLKRKIERHWNKLYAEFVLIRFLSKVDLKDSIIHTELAPWMSLLALLQLSRKAQVFVTMHNSLPPVTKWRFYLTKLKFGILSRTKNFHLFTANQDTKQKLAEFVPAKFLEKVKVIYANVNSEEIQTALDDELNRQEYLEKYRIPNKKFLVFCVGQFIDRKGRWIFLEAARKLVKDNSDMAFVWISNSKITVEEMERARSFGLGKDFVFISSEQIGSEHIDLFKLLRLADIFALPSYLEGLPISILEAMALGIPTISTNINAIPEAIKHLETGILIEPGDSDALAAAIQKLKDEPKLCERLAKNGRNYVLENFEEKNVAKIAVQTYLKAFQAGGN